MLRLRAAAASALGRAPPRRRLVSGAFAFSDRQAEHFREKGFLVLESVVAPTLLDAMKRRAEEIVAEYARSRPQDQVSVFTTQEQQRKSDAYFLSSGDKVRCFFEEHAFDKSGKLTVPVERAVNKIGHNMHEMEPAFRRFSNSPLVMAVASGLGFKDPRILQGMYIFKQPHIGGAVNPHQDSTFLYTVPDSTVGLWLAVEDAELETGCLWAVPGSHTRGVARRFRRTPDGLSTVFEPAVDAGLSTEGGVALPVPRGSVIVLHGALVHWSAQNRSPRSRHAYTVHMIEGSLPYPRENWLQREDGKPFMQLTGEF